MKRKTVVLLSSVLAGALIVGGAFASYAVTDNAEKNGITITGGDLHEDSKTYVTLSWGTSTQLAGIGNFAAGEVRKAGVVALASTSAEYEGVFSLTLADSTTREANFEGERLLDYLDVYVFEGKDITELPTGETPAPKATILHSDEDKELEFNQVGSTTGVEYSILVKLDTSVVKVYDTVKSDTVYLEVDWSPKSGDEATSGLVYFSKPNTWGSTDKVYAHAFNGSVVNAAWPGVEMTEVGDNLYCLTVESAAMGYIVFNNNESGTKARQTGDIPFVYDDENQDYDEGHAYWNNGTAWEETPSTEAPTISATKNGNPIELVDKVQPGDTENNHIYELVLEEGDVIIVKNDLAVVTFAGGENSYTATVDGKHTFYYSKDGKIYVVAPVVNPTYYVVGVINGEGAWSSTEHPLIVNPENEGEYMLENPIALKVGDGIKVSNGTDYYPGGNGTEFSITKDGNYDIYFRPDAQGGEGWYYGYFYIGEAK